MRSALMPLARVGAVAALAAGVLLGADRLDLPAEADEPTGTRDVAVDSSALTCPGDPFVGDGAPQATVTGEAVLAPFGPDALADLVTVPEAPGSTELGPGDAAGADGDLRRLDALGADPVTARASGQSAPGVVAGQSLEVGGEEAYGLAVTGCTEPSADQWLVAGGGEAGRQERLVLSNPGANPVSVDVSFLTPDGPQAPGGGQGVVVPAGERTEVLLDGLSGTRAAQVVRVQSEGGQVVAAVSDVWLDGLDPSGVELVGPTAEPATRQVLPGNANGAGRGLVLGAPGEEDAVVEVRGIAEDEEQAIEVVTVPAGRLAEVDLPEMPGVHTWVVESDVPVVAGAWTLSPSGEGGVRDLAWSVAAPEVGTLAGAALPAGLPEDVRRFVEVTAGEEDAQVEVILTRGGETETETVDVPAGRSRVLSVGAVDAVRASTEAEDVRAAVLLSQADGEVLTSSVPLVPTPLTVQDVPVTNLD